MRYRSVPLTGKKVKEVGSSLTSLDKAILKKAERGEDIVGIISACKPYRNKWGGKAFASTDEVLAAVSKLYKAGLLERR